MIRQWEDLLRRSAEKICWENLLRRSAEKICWEKICWEDLLRRSAEENLLRRSAEKICWKNLLRRSAEKICWEKICWEDLLRRSAEKICWEDLLKKSAEKICWEWLWIKTSLKFLSFFTQGGFGRSRRETTLSSFRAHRTSKTVVKCEFWNYPRNPLVTSCSSDVQNWGEMRILYVVVATLSSFRAHRTSKTEVKCESAWVVGQPSRRFVLIGRLKLRWNANLWLRSWTLSSLRAGQMSETVVKCWFLYAAGCPGRRALDSYILVHAAVVKRTFWKCGWHAVVARRTFCFCWMNPLVGFGGSMARNCGETQIFFWNCRRLRAKRSFWKLCSMKIWGSFARNARFGSLFCEIWRKSRAKRSFLKLVLWKFEEASHETLVLEACSLKFRGSLARNARFGSLFCEICRKSRAKRSFLKLVLWKFEEASHETLVLEACSLKFRGSLARNVRFGSLFCEIWKPRTKRSFWKLCLWNFEEASHETLVLEACSVKFAGSLARNVRFGSLFCEITMKPRTKRSFWKLCVFSVFSFCVFSLCVFSLCVFSLCVFSLCVFCLCFLSAFFLSVCFLSVCFLSLCFLSVCFLSVFSICVFFGLEDLFVFAFMALRCRTRHWPQRVVLINFDVYHKWCLSYTTFLSWYHAAKSYRWIYVIKRSCATVLVYFALLIVLISRVSR